MGRLVLGVFAVTYLAAGAAPCVAAASRDGVDTAVAHGLGARSHAGHAAHEDLSAAAHGHDAHGHGGRGTKTRVPEMHVGSPPAYDDTPAAGDGGRHEHCLHCPLGGAAAAHNGDHSSCPTLEDLASTAAPQAKAVVPPLAPLQGPAAFTLPPPLASLAAPPPLRAAVVAPVPLNVRHCVFLI